MTHQPPIPDAATSPYPLHPEPVQGGQPALPPVQEAGPAPKTEGVSTTMLGVGAAIGIGAAAAVGLIYARRSRKAPAKPKAKTSGDNKAKRGKPDRSRVAAGEPYEVAYFARKHKISAAEARAILKEAGADRDAANALAKRGKA